MVVEHQQRRRTGAGELDGIVPFVEHWRATAGQHLAGVRLLRPAASDEGERQQHGAADDGQGEEGHDR